MKPLAQTRSSAPHKWELASLGRRVPRSLRQARDLSTARRIVATAEGIFAEQGLAGARMDEIISGKEQSDNVTRCAPARNSAEFAMTVPPLFRPDF